MVSERSEQNELMKPDFLPEDWNVVKLKEVISDVVSGDWGKKSPSEKGEYIKCKVIRGTDFPVVEKSNFNSTPERFLKKESIKKRSLRRNDILIEISGGSKKQPTGRIMMVSQDFAGEMPLTFSNFVKKLSIKGTCCHNLFFYYLWLYLYYQGRTRVYEKRTTGIYNFKYKDFLDNEIVCLPSSIEQHSIAYILSTIQQAIEATDKVITAAQELKKSLMQHLFTYGPVSLEEAEQVPQKNMEIGRTPYNWNEITLDRIVKLSSGKTKPKDLKKQPINDYKYPVFGGNGIIGYTKEYLVNNETIIIGRVGEYCGSVHLSKSSCWVTDNAIYIKYLEISDISLAYLALCLQRLNLNKHKKKSSQPLISQSLIYSQAIPLPKKFIQEKIVCDLNSVDKKIDIEQRRKNTLESLFNSLLHHLMTGKLRVNDLDLNIPEEVAQ